MWRYRFYIDGFNVYYALKFPQYRQYKWLDYSKLAESVVGSKDKVTGIFYFTAFVHWKPHSVRRHKAYIRALRSVGVEVVLGEFKNKQIKCHLCGRLFGTHEEKRTDVNIAVRILSDAIDDSFDRAVIVSADSDLLPVISCVRRYAPDKEVGIMFPIGRNSFDLRSAVDFRLRMPQKLLRACQFSDKVKRRIEMLRKPDTTP